MNPHDLPHVLKDIVDAISFVAIATTLAGLLPPIAAVFSIVWTALRIYETSTVQRIIHGKE
jgi:chromate transport protein ChrA